MLCCIRGTPPRNVKPRPGKPGSPGRPSGLPHTAQLTVARSDESPGLRTAEQSVTLPVPRQVPLQRHSRPLHLLNTVAFIKHLPALYPTLILSPSVPSMHCPYFPEENLAETLMPCPRHPHCSGPGSSTLPRELASCYELACTGTQPDVEAAQMSPAAPAPCWSKIQYFCQVRMRYSLGVEVLSD